MKVIKENKSTMRVNCKKCDAELEISAGDLKKEPDDDWGYGAYYYVCPCCHSTQYRLLNEVSKQVRAEFSRLNENN